MKFRLLHLFPGKSIARAAEIARPGLIGLGRVVRLCSNDQLAWSEYLNRPERIQKRFDAFRRRRKVTGGHRHSASIGEIEIVISCYNHGRFLARALGGIALQSYDHRIPVTLVENGSTDDTREVISKLNIDPKIDLNLVLLDRNVGMAAGFNAGIKMARKNMVTLLCADDCLVPNFLAGALEAFNLYTDIVMLGGSSIWFSTDEELDAHLSTYQNISFASTVRRCVPDDHDISKGPNAIGISLSSLTFLRSVWQEVGGLQKRKRRRITEYDDRDFELRVAALYPVGITSAALMYYRVGSSNWTP